MDITSFIQQLQDTGIRLWIEGDDRLRCSAPEGALTQELAKQISEYKGEIITFLHRSNFVSKASIADSETPAISPTNVDAALEKMAKDGFCIIPSVISPKEADEARTRLHQIAATEMTASIRKTKLQSISHLILKDNYFLKLMCHPTPLAIWQKYLGADMIAATWMANVVYPGFERHQWHADYPYWTMTPPWPDMPLGGQTIWMLDDFTEANGGTGIVPNTRLHGCPPDHPGKDRNDAVHVTGSAGSILIFDAATWHSARPNRSDQPRALLANLYIRSFCTPMENMRAQLAKIEQPTVLMKQLMGANQYQPDEYD